MSYTIKYNGPIDQINGGGDTIQIILTFDVDYAGSNQVHSMVNYHIVPQYDGSLSWQYDLDDALIIPGMCSFKLYDKDEHLHNRLFGTTARDLATDKRFKVELKFNGATEFIGYAIERTITYNMGDHLLSFQAAPKTDILNTTALYDDSIPFDPLELCLHTEVNITQITQNDTTLVIDHDSYPNFATGQPIKIRDVVGMTDANTVHEISIKNSNTQIEIELATDQTYTSGGTVQRLNVGATNIYYALTSILEGCYALAGDVSYSGGTLEIYHDWVFYARYASYPAYTSVDLTEIMHMVDELFFDPNQGLTNVADVLRQLAIDWFCYTGMIHEERAFFKKLFYYDASNVQSLGSVLRHDKTYKYDAYDCIVIEDRDGVLTPYYAPGKNYYTEQTNRSLVRTTWPSFCFEWPTASISSSNLRYTLDTDASIWKAKDTLIDADWQRYAYLMGELMYYYRCNNKFCRVDRFDVEGVDYDFVKNFNYDGIKYQIVGMKKYFGKEKEACHTIIDALYIGEL